MGEPIGEYHMTSDQRNKFDRISKKLIAKRRGLDERDLSDLKETHLVLAPYETLKILEFIGVKEGSTNR
jgi:hypothetical protein